jgi:hypothetical protein
VTPLPSWTVRAWGLDDPRVVSALAHENQAGRGTLRQRDIEERARKAGWPREMASLEMQRQARQRSRVTAAKTYKRRAREGLTAVRDETAQPVTIFDE